VFPSVVDQLARDLDSAHDLLAARRTDRYTQVVQRQIEETLTELIAALEQAKKKNQQTKQSPPKPPKPPKPSMPKLPPLFPPTAELKLLRAAQIRVNHRTQAIQEAAAGKPLDDTLQQETRTVARQQEQVVKLTEEMIENQ
jgi:hypothetical protein